MDDKGLDLITPETEVYQNGDQVITVAPVTMGRLRAFVRASAPLALPLSILARGVRLENTLLYASSEEDMRRFVCAAIGLEESDLHDWQRSNLADIVGAVVRVNTDFFALRLLQAKREMQGPGKAKRIRNGLTRLRHLWRMVTT